jgi:Kef-type K+ transport system membrane component KefB
LAEVEDAIRQSIDLYTTIVESNSTADFNSMVAQVADTFQKFVLAHKTTKHLQDQESPKQPTQNKTLVDHLLDDVKEKADDVEDEKEDVFVNKQQENTTSIETVIKVHDSDTHVLIDSANNQYVLSKSGDITSSVEDTVFLKDIAMLLIACFLSVLVMHLLGVPLFFGYLAAGIGMSLNKLVSHIIQVETISRGLGSIFIMFYLGLEFSPSKIQRVWNISLLGSFLLLLLTLGVCVTVGGQFGAQIQESIVIGSCLFLSSTAVVVHLLQSKELETGYGRSIMGILVCQDVMLGFLLALMPVLKTTGIEVMYTMLKLLGYLGLFLLIAGLVQIPFKYGLHRLKKNKELFCLTSLAYCLVIAQIGELCNQSVELSCFVAGMYMASSKPLADGIEHTLESVKSIFGGLFFASIGLHIYPSFLIKEGLLLIVLTLIVVLVKIFLATMVIHFIFRRTWRTAIVISVGLAQVSEFTFVLASKAKRYCILM